MIDLEKHLPKKCGFDPKKVVVTPGQTVALAKDFETDYTGTYKDKKDAEADLASNVQRLADQQDLLYASNTYALLILFQALDAAGKDGTIKHVMSGVNPEGCEVFSFKEPSSEELRHDFIWRCAKVLPERGRIGIFNRSYYEEVLVVRVHPELLAPQHLPSGSEAGSRLWQGRYEDINNFEHHLHRSGTRVVKFFLHVSKEEQRRRLLARLDDPAKQWKFSPADLAERSHFDEYQQAYEKALTATSTSWAPWYVIPADEKPVTHALVAAIVLNAIDELKLHLPPIGDEQATALDEARKALAAE
jgi:PPK2 family polyphosphate:nucleotide phosphotransferase